MSDPALRLETDVMDFLPLSSVPRDKEAVYVFDFDGVIASGIEDKIYRLAETPLEKERLKEAEKELGLKIAGMDFRYRRHLVFQELAARKGLEIPVGPGLPLAQWVSQNARFFILTARSGWAATERLRAFLVKHHLRPIDLYQVGRVLKDRQIKKIH
ncbi:MAG: hypothetical protein AAGE89_15335, partial [Pseudomonadota bacterium]